MQLALEVPAESGRKRPRQLRADRRPLSGADLPLPARGVPSPKPSPTAPPGAGGRTPRAMPSNPGQRAAVRVSTPHAAPRPSRSTRAFDVPGRGCRRRLATTRLVHQLHPRGRRPPRSAPALTQGATAAAARRRDRQSIASATGRGAPSHRRGARSPADADRRLPSTSSYPLQSGGPQTVRVSLERRLFEALAAFSMPVRVRRDRPRIERWITLSQIVIQRRWRSDGRGPGHPLGEQEPGAKF